MALKRRLKYRPASTSDEMSNSEKRLPERDTIVIMSNKAPRVELESLSRRFHVVSVDWLFDSISSYALRPYSAFSLVGQLPPPRAFNSPGLFKSPPARMAAARTETPVKKMPVSTKLKPSKAVKTGKTGKGTKPTMSQPSKQGGWKALPDSPPPASGKDAKVRTASDALDGAGSGGKRARKDSTAARDEPRGLLGWMMHKFAPSL